MGVGVTTLRYSFVSLFASLGSKAHNTFALRSRSRLRSDSITGKKESQDKNGAWFMILSVRSPRRNHCVFMLILLKIRDVTV